jgi:hypothetical protein
MRFLSGRSRLAKTLIAATTVAVTATAGVVAGVGVAHAVSTNASSQFNTSIVGTATDTAQRTFTSTNWTTVGSFSMFPATNMNHVLARFSAQSKCVGSSDGWCSVRIVVNQFEASPADGTNFVWQWEGGTETWGARSMERIVDAFVGTNITITVQAALRGGATSFTIQDWIISAQAY